VDDATEQTVINFALQFPVDGQHRTNNELRENSVLISGGGVQSICLRHALENFKKRLKALEAKVAKDGIELKNHQIAALERKHEDDIACGEIETRHPEYLEAQDIFCVGLIYQQTFIDTYSKVVHYKLYTTKTPIKAADLMFGKPLYINKHFHLLNYQHPPHPM